MAFKCPYCDNWYRDKNILKSHLMLYQFYPCLTCADEFHSINSLENHCDNAIHRPPPLAPESLNEKLQLYLEEAYYMEKVVVTRTDRRKSRVLVLDLLKKMMVDVTKQQYGEIYSAKIQPAGSTSTQTKIVKADEFDFNIVLKQKFHSFKHHGKTVSYDLAKHAFQPLDKHIGMVKVWNDIDNDGIDIPNGYCTPEHSNIAAHNLRRLSHNKELIPRWVQQDLYKKILNALNGRKHIQLKCVPTGPAITMIITHLNHCSNEKHDISIDLSASIETNIPVGIYGWPRPETRKVLSPEQIENIKKAGIILVPKHERFWYISFSKAVTSLMQFIDGADECRRKCHKILKRDFMTWQSQSDHGLKGISTYLFKHHLFWMNEDKQHLGKDYWAKRNIGECYIDMLQSLEKQCQDKFLPNYFNTKENILAKKTDSVLKELANCCRERRLKLLHIKMA